MKSIVMFLLAVFAVVVVIPMNSAEARTCFRCDGKGYIETYEPAEWNHYTGKKMRDGYTKTERCPSCGGRGYKD